MKGTSAARSTAICRRARLTGVALCAQCCTSQYAMLGSSNPGGRRPPGRDAVCLSDRVVASPISQTAELSGISGFERSHLRVAAMENAQASLVPAGAAPCPSDGSGGAGCSTSEPGGVMGMRDQAEESWSIVSVTVSPLPRPSSSRACQNPRAARRAGPRQCDRGPGLGRGRR